VEHGLDDEEITADNDNNVTTVLEETGRKDVALVVQSQRVRVERTPVREIGEKYTTDLISSNNKKLTFPTFHPGRKGPIQQEA
jgi:hypothetical protein